LTGYFIGLIYIVDVIFWTSCLSASRHLYFRAGCQIRGVLMEATFAKGLAAHKSTIEAVGPGALSAFLTIDIERIVTVSDIPCPILQLPLMYVLGTVIVWHEFGWRSACTLGLLVVISTICLPFTADITTKAQDEWSKATDKRIRLISSVLGCMKALKYSAQESVIVAKVAALRRKEMTAFSHFRLMWLNTGWQVIP
jgi:ATP-binding cassette subfamily C (CFTR/MRP) protein 1